MKNFYHLNRTLFQAEIGLSVLYEEENIWFFENGTPVLPENLEFVSDAGGVYLPPGVDINEEEFLPNDRDVRSLTYLRSGE